jgi:membrane protease YdiL (CAAX protease family)
LPRYQLPPLDFGFSEPNHATECDGMNVFPTGHTSTKAAPLFTKPHPNFWWAILWCLGLFIFAQVPAAVVAVVYLFGASLLFPQRIDFDSLRHTEQLRNSPIFSQASCLALFLAQVLTICFSLAALRLTAGRDWARKTALRRPGLGHTFLVILALPALVILANVIYELLRDKLHFPSIPGMKMFTEIIGSWPWTIAILVIGVGPGIGEELFCRAFLGRGLIGRYGTVAGVLFASFFFGLIHIDPCQGTMAALMGLWLHFIYLTTRSLWIPMLVHFMNNSVAVLAPRHPALKALDDTPGVVPIYLVLAACLVLAAVGIALYRSRARIISEDPEKAPWEPAFEGVELPPRDSGSRIEQSAVSLLDWAGAVLAVLVFAGTVYWAFRTSFN